MELGFSYFFKLYLTASLIFSSAVQSATKVMTFNTMCDFCNGSDFLDYNKRAQSLSKIIQKYSPDILALQEVRTKSQVESILKNSPQYEFYCTDSLLMSYADPAIVYDKNKFTLLDKGQSWLGPTPDSLNFGWKWALPRQFLWVKLKRKKDNEKFIFITSHFDNRIENLAGAAKLLNSTFKNEALPFIFAGDTNLTSDLPIYSQLLKDVFINAFDIKKSLALEPKKEGRDLCYLKKGKIFPECRVDHILLSKKDNWSVESYRVDQTKNYNNHFPSDHRPVMIELNLLN